MNLNTKEIDLNGLKDLQLEILLDVHKFCQEKNIKYSLACGTLIGAIRHKGFIPWDDDIDICLLREEYKKLEDAFPKLLNGKYQFLTLNRDNDWYMPWGKVIDTRTVLTEETRYKNKNLGVFIDVFPMDDVYDTKKTFLEWNKTRRFLLHRWFLKNARFPRTWNFKRYVHLILERILLIPFSMRNLAKLIDIHIQKPNDKGYTRVFESCDSLGARHNQSKEDFEDYIDVDFEGYKFKAMAGYDDYLHNIYGDYMILPPMEKRVSHHSFSAHWK